MRSGRSLIAVGILLGALAFGGVSTAATSSTPKLKLYFKNGFSLGHQVVTVPGRSITIEGYEQPYVPDQWVTVQAWQSGHKFHQGPLHLSPVSNATFGRFILKLAPPHAGQVTIVAFHPSTTGLTYFNARKSFNSIDTSVGFGSTGPGVQLIQSRLAALHFFIPQTGVYDSGTGLAIDAYHRLLGWGTYQTLDSRTVNALMTGQGQFHIRYPGDGKHAEGDLTNQLLALANGSSVYWILPISSGKPSTPTILGRFHVYSRVPGYLPDGMYYSDFFFSGYAIHGYNPAPDYPASHGCMRLPIQDAIPVFNWLAMGDAVDTYF